MQIPIQSGVRIRDGAFATSFPVNLEHRVVESGLSKGQLVTTRGAIEVAQGPGTDRGGIVWRGMLYRAMGSRLVRVSSDFTIEDLGDIGDDGQPATFDYSFDRLAIRSGECLFYFAGTTLTKVTDSDLGIVLDVAWLDGYFVTTDGESIVVTELLDPAAVDPLRYGSAEADPDPVTGLLRHRQEIVAFGRHSIQFFRNVGGVGFPFAVTPGATIPVGCVSPRAKCLVGKTFAFVGGARDEPIGVYVGLQGSAERVSTPEIDDWLAAVPEGDIRLEPRVFGEDQQLVIHTERRSMALSLKASGEIDDAAWHVLHSGNFGQYRPRNAIFCYGRHICGDSASSRLGVLTEDTFDQFGAPSQWQLEAGMLFNEGKAMILREVELFGRQAPRPATLFLSLTRDGEVWSNEVALRLSGRRDQRLMWRPNTRLPAIAGIRVRGTDHFAVVRADVDGEPLSV